MSPQKGAILKGRFIFQHLPTINFRGIRCFSGEITYVLMMEEILHHGCMKPMQVR